MPKIQFRCQNTPEQKVTHSIIIYFCQECQISLCSNCLIRHLFFPHKSADNIINIEQVFENSKKSVGAISDEITKAYKSSKTKVNSKYNFNELITQKKTNINR